MVKQFNWRRRYELNNNLMLQELLRVTQDKLPYQRASRKMTSILHKYLATATAAAERSAHRFTAERWLFDEAQRQEKSFRCITIRFGRVRELIDQLYQAGFDMLWSQVHAFVEYGWCCKEAGKKALGIRLLEEMRLRAQSARLKSGPARYYDEMIKECVTALRSGHRQRP